MRQPFARAIAAGLKTVENRRRNVTYRGELAIHAAQRPSLAGDVDPRIVRAFGQSPRLGAPTGAIVAVAELVDCHEAEQPLPVDATCCWPWGDRTYGSGPAFHLVLANVRTPLNPVSCRGALTIGWTVPQDTEELVRIQLGLGGAA